MVKRFNVIAQKAGVLSALTLSLCLTSVASAGDAKPETKISGPDAFALLKKGNERFYSEKTDRENTSKDYRSQLLNNQKPHSVVISCSDSRVPPEYIFDQGFGQIYSIRLIGEVLDSSAIASVENAVEHLGTKLIVVMGHDSCDAVRAAYDVPAGKSAGSAHLDKILNFIRPGIEKFKKVSESDRTLHAAVKANVFAVSKELVKESKIIFERLKKKDVSLVQGVYNMSSGKVEFSDDIGPVLAQLIMTESPSRKISSDDGEPKEKKKSKKKKSKEASEKKEGTEAAAPAQPEVKKEEKKEDKKEEKPKDSSKNEAKPEKKVSAKKESKETTAGENPWKAKSHKDSY